MCDFTHKLSTLWSLVFSGSVDCIRNKHHLVRHCCTICWHSAPPRSCDKRHQGQSRRRARSGSDGVWRTTQTARYPRTDRPLYVRVRATALACMETINQQLRWAVIKVDLCVCELWTWTHMWQPDALSVDACENDIVAHVELHDNTS